MKKSILSFVCCLGYIITFSQIPTSGLTGYWSFDGNANDLSSNSNNGTIYGASLSTDRFGNTNKCFSFNGINNYIETSTNNVITNEYSYSAWALTNSLPNTGTGTYVLFVGGWGSSQVINTNNNVGVNNGWGGNGYNTSNPIQYVTYQGSNLIPSQWVHIVITRSSKSMKLYINCNLIKTDSTSYTTLPYYGSSPVLKIGTRDNNTGFFDGKIDDIRIYNRAITPSEVCQLYSEPNPILNGIKENSIDENIFSIYPVPSSNKINISCGANISLLENKINCTILSADGKPVKEINLNKTEFENSLIIDVQNLSKGLYNFNLISGNYTQNLRFILE